MGVGDFVHSREAGQPRTVGTLPPSQRQLRAEQAKVEVPKDYFNEPTANGNGFGRGFQASPVPSDFSRDLTTKGPPPDSRGGRRDAFDTDVEAIDDSTIAETSVFEHDDRHSQAALANNIDVGSTSPRPSYLPRPTHRQGRSSFFGGLGDKVMKKAGFDTTDDGEDTASQLTSSIGGDDEMTEVIEEQPSPAPPQEPIPAHESRDSKGWYLSQKNRSVEEPLSKRLEQFWSASKRPAQVSSPVEPEARQTMQANHVADAQPRKLGHLLPPPGARKITLPHNISGTPRTRFSPPKPSLLEQLDISPTRRNSERHDSEPPPQAGRMTSMASTFRTLDPSENDIHHQPGEDETIRIDSRRHSPHSAHDFELTNLSDLVNSDLDREDEEMTHIPYLNHHTSTSRGRRNTVIKTKKRQLEADYPPQILYQKSFSDLQAEPFDKAPTPIPSPPAKSPSLPAGAGSLSNGHSPDEALFQLLRLTDQERQAYLNQLSVDEWEDCGDQLIDRFSHLLIEMRKLRRARRQTAAVFEAEIRRRHDLVEAQDSELSSKLNEMRTGGAEVLRGRGT
ncbi:hypothetical protein POX_f07993 [Penicillium oxalicum]|uniref:Extracellular mutant protein 11 C-terminal domain-containing protein n=1 Tax=Penicillium oxalicum (strain 114-2 / CGMCC 5302) TaxID=933388 RepID=S7ZF70_PENO1|nr:hypothetical protein POX_f07993 [Penicillium oxalicum]EPS28919.1 hypothetical protein PDE_03865 [Penicillium oxalicum 114-2]KAI2787620.1 hypothetical protein POX_f07993 [Penicillium oxalicum]